MMERAPDKEAGLTFQIADCQKLFLRIFSASDFTNQTASDFTQIRNELKRESSWLKYSH